MNNQILTTLKKNLEQLAEHGGAEAEIQRNAVKETLQYYVLNFIYHHPQYNNWIMYGGSALRICHHLDRMSVDLDFEVDHAVTNDFLDELKDEIVAHFKDVYDIGSDWLSISATNNRGLTLKFHIIEELGLNFHSKRVHVKIDLNHFPVHPKIATERWPQNAHQLSFAIKTYNMSALMASKIAAIFLREARGLDGSMYDYKGRDIYDLLWYMEKQIIPDFDYLAAKNINISDPKSLFNTLTVDILNYEKMDELLAKDLAHLFSVRSVLDAWLQNWRRDYLQLLGKYKIFTITALKKVVIFEDMMTDNFSFIFRYDTAEGTTVKIIYKMSDRWVDIDLFADVDPAVDNLIEFNSNGISSLPAPREKLKKYANLFNQKNEQYFQKTNRVVIGDAITTKFIRMTADNLNPKEEILLNESTLSSCELEDLLK